MVFISNATNNLFPYRCLVVLLADFFPPSEIAQLLFIYFLSNKFYFPFYQTTN